jgi:hypothetical protein
MIPINDDVALIVGVVNFIAQMLGEDPHCVPSTNRRIVNSMVGMALISEACGNDADSIQAFVADCLKADSKIITIDSV